tara:strand:- start:663 stop:1283 length:621 start_codon:yes stop_codon:yes gene_type:complete
MTTKTKVKKQEPRYKQPRDIEYFFKEKVDDMTIDQWISSLESIWCMYGWFEKKDGIMFSDEDTTRWIRNPFHKDDDRTKQDNFDILYINSNGVVVNFKELRSLGKDQDYEFQELYEQHWSIHFGKLNQMTINHRNGTPNFIGHYQVQSEYDLFIKDKDKVVKEDGLGKRDGMFLYQNIHGCSVGGEYKDNELVKTYSGLMTISTMQ